MAEIKIGTRVRIDGPFLGDIDGTVYQLTGNEHDRIYKMPSGPDINDYCMVRLDKPDPSGATIYDCQKDFLVVLS